jgi:hypothetical protein
MVVVKHRPVRENRRPRLMKRIPPSMELSLLAEELRQRNDVPDLLGELMRLGGRRMIQELLTRSTSRSASRPG